MGYNKSLFIRQGYDLTNYVILSQHAVGGMPYRKFLQIWPSGTEFDRNKFLSDNEFI